jgi:hypothetical protein
VSSVCIKFGNPRPALCSLVLVDFDPESLFDPSWDAETRKLRGTRWTVVNWILPLRLVPASVGGVDYLAHRPQLLPRVPTTGESLEAVRHRATGHRCTAPLHRLGLWLCRE